jgi:DNA polymerase-3 subunit delta'
MGFETLLGNSRLKDNLTASLQQGKTAHFYLISGPRGSGKQTLAKLLSAAAMCEDKNRPCGKCENCRKIMAGVHPDVITVTDPDHKTVPVRIIRQMRDDVFIRPNEGNKKIYIFPQELGIEGQNALLKILEEPPSYGLFLLLTENSEKILPTVRSRCAEFGVNGGQPEEKAERPELPMAYLKTVASGDEAQLLRFCAQAEAMDNAAALEFTRDCREILADVLCGREKSLRLSPEQAMSLVELMDRCAAYLKVNVGVKHIFGLLAVLSIVGSGNRG